MLKVACGISSLSLWYPKKLYSRLLEQSAFVFLFLCNQTEIPVDESFTFEVCSRDDLASEVGSYQKQCPSGNLPLYSNYGLLACGMTWPQFALNALLRVRLGCFGRQASKWVRSVLLICSWMTWPSLCNCPAPL